jgi:hypothetical protein
MATYILSATHKSILLHCAQKACAVLSVLLLLLLLLLLL